MIGIKNQKPPCAELVSKLVKNLLGEFGKLAALNSMVTSYAGSLFGFARKFVIALSTVNFVEIAMSEFASGEFGPLRIPSLV